MDLVREAQEYVEALRADKVTDTELAPLNRLEPDAVMFNFVWYLGDYNKQKGTKRKSPLYTAGLCPKMVTVLLFEATGTV